MSVVEVCDICREEVSKHNGITIVFSDMKGLGFRGDDPCIVQRNYKARICDKCKENIIKYCKKNARKR